MYRCPGNRRTPNTITPQEAEKHGCKTIEGAPVTIDPDGQAAPAAARRRVGRGARTGRRGERVDPATQRARDGDARAHPRGRAAARGGSGWRSCSKEYNNGEPERLGSERNYQKYLDRVGRDAAPRSRARRATSPRIKRELAEAAAAAPPQ